MRLRKNFLISVGSCLVAIVLIGTLVLWRLGYFKQNFGALTDKDVAEALAKMRGPAPAIQTAPERIEPGRRVRLAIGSVGLPTEQQSRNVSDLTLALLNDAKGLEMVERQALDKVLAELQLSAAGLVRARDAVRAGKVAPRRLVLARHAGDRQRHECSRGAHRRRTHRSHARCDHDPQ
jgi:hypothetical protein